MVNKKRCKVLYTGLLFPNALISGQKRKILVYLRCFIMESKSLHRTSESSLFTSSPFTTPTTYTNKVTAFGERLTLLDST